jgi:hypothetical protein
VDLGEHAPQPVRGRGDLGGEVVVEAGQHAQLGDLSLVHPDVAQGVRHGPGRLGDDQRIACVGLGRARVQIRDPAHRQSRQVRHLYAVGGSGDGHRQGPDRGRLVHDHQHRPVRGGQLLEDGPQAGLVVGQGLVVDRLPRARDGHGVMVGLADVEADEHRRGWLL